MTSLDGNSTQTNRAWRTHGLVLALLIGLILIAFRDAAASAVVVWWVYPTYSHCFLIIPICLWLIWEKREQLKRLYPRTQPLALLALPFVLLAWWLGALSTINELQQFAIIGLVQVALLAVLGWQVYRTIWFAALFLFFLVPTGQYLIAPMQHFATVFADRCLSMLGVPHYTHGTVIDLANGSFEIAEACAGLRFLIATVSLGILYAYLTFRRWHKIILFMIACVIIPLVANGLRVVGIILLAHFTNEEYGVGADHLVYGWVFNVAILLVLFLIGAYFRDHINEGVGPTGGDAKPEPAARMTGVFAVFALLIVAAPALANWHESNAGDSDVAGLSRDTTVWGWQGSSWPEDWRPSFPDSDISLYRAFVHNPTQSDAQVDVYLAYYSRAQRAHVLTGHLNHLWDSEAWNLLSTNTASALLSGRPTRFHESIISSAIGRRIVWNVYWVNGHFVTKPLAVKLLQIPAWIEGHEGQAIFAISTRVENSDGEARGRLRQALAAIKNLPERLQAASRGRALSAR